MANKNFEVKHGLSVGGTERITAAGAGSLTNLTLSGNLTVQGTTVTLDASTLQVADKNIVLNYHASNDTSSASSGAGITIQDAVNGTTDATILWDASDDEFDFSHGINIPNLKVSGGQGTDGQLLTSTGSGVAWEDAPASGPTFKAFGTSSIMVGDSTTGTINGANYNTGLGVDVFAALTTGDSNVAVGFEAGKSIISGGDSNTFVGTKAGKLNNTYQSTYIGNQAGENVVGNRGLGIGHLAMSNNIGATTNDIGIGFLAMQYKDAISGGNIAIGSLALRGVNTSSTSGYANVAIGSNAMSGYTTAKWNVAVGDTALTAITTGTYNVAIGRNAGAVITTGSKNVVIGHYDGNENGLDIRTSSNNIVLSDGDANIRMRIDSSGNVGIGNISPATNLHIGSGTEGQNLGVKLNRGATTNFFIACDGTKQAYIGVDNTEGHMKMGSLSNHPVQISQANGSAIYIDTSKNVGIGTTSPSTPLHVYSSTSGVIATISGPNDYNAETGISLSVDRAKISGVLNGSSGSPGASLRFHTQPDSGSLTERMRITSAGSVGIGTTSPGTSTEGLHVVHDATEGTPSFPSGEVIIAQRNFNSSQGCHIGIIGGSASESAINFGDKDNSDAGIISYKHNGDYMSFTTNTTERMVINSAGTMILKADGAANYGRIQFSDQATTYQILGGNYVGYLGYKTGGYHRWFGSDGAEDMRLDSSGNLKVERSLQYSGGRHQKGIYHFQDTSGASGTTYYAHFKTNIPISANTMTRWEFEGYNYGATKIVRCEWACHSSNSVLYSLSYRSLNNGFQAANIYASSDNYIVIVASYTVRYYVSGAMNIHDSPIYGTQASIISAHTITTSNAGAY